MFYINVLPKGGIIVRLRGYVKRKKSISCGKGRWFGDQNAFEEGFFAC